MKLFIAFAFTCAAVAAQAAPTHYSITRTCSSGTSPQDMMIEQASGMTIDGTNITFAMSMRSSGGNLCMSTVSGTIQGNLATVTSGNTLCEDGLKPTKGLPTSITFTKLGDKYQLTEAGFGQGGTCPAGSTMTVTFSPIL